MPRSQVPAFLRDPVQRAELAAELHTLADQLTPNAPDFEGGTLPVDRLTVVRAARLRTWAGAVEEFGAALHADTAGQH